MNVGCLILGMIIAFGICGHSDIKAVSVGRIQLRGKWYKLVEIPKEE